MALTGDRGARSIVAEADEVTVVDMPAAAHDIDTPEDARRLRDTRPGRAGR
jgi:CTP:molybdopterin cytidylyltransferase MocA